MFRIIEEHGHPRTGKTDAAADYTAVERHRQEKLLRAELKSMAKKRFYKREEARRRRRKQAAAAKVVERTPGGEIEVDAASKELAKRILTRRRLVEFVKEFHPRYKAGWVHHDICAKLEQFAADVQAGKSPRLMILMPPRHGKSQIASKLYPAWHLGHYPDHEVIACSYNLSLALDFSREVRGVLRTERYAKLFEKTKLDPEREGAEAWRILPVPDHTAGGYVAAGIGGPINGKGAHVLIIDDPIKNAEEAESIDHLKKIHDWFDSTAYTRLAPGGGVLVIQTWWSDNDLAGKLQEEMTADPEADQYEIVKYPAIATEDEAFRVKGDPLHPERFDLAALERIRRKLGGEKGRYWNALYQQNPIPDEGAYFTKNMFVYRAARPNLAICHIYQTWDFAAGEKRHNDWTVGFTVAVDHEDTAHVIEMVRFRSGDQLKQANEILEMYRRYPAVQALGVEDGQIWKGIRAHLMKRLTEERLYPNIEELPTFTDKTVRARALQGRMLQRKVTFPHSADWLGVLLKEFLRFPVGMHDDMVDSLAHMAAMILRHAPPRRPEPPRNRKEPTMAEKLRKLASPGGGKSHMSA